jgi:hypothetical protein
VAFPRRNGVRHEGTIRKMHQQAETRADQWDKDFPRLIGDTPVGLLD